MVEPDLGARISEKIAEKLTQLEHRLTELESDTTLRAELAAVEREVAAVKTQLDAARQHGEEGVEDIGLELRLEARLERLLAQKERCQLRLELHDEKRDRIRETMEELRTNYGVGVAPRPRTEPRPAAPPPDSRRLQEEQRKILEMLQAGRINAGEAAQLLDALRKQDDARQRRRAPRWVRIRVTDIATNRIRVNLTLPVGLVRAGLRAGGNIAGVERLDTAELEDMLNRGEIGHLIDVVDEDQREHVEVFVE